MENQENISFKDLLAKVNKDKPPEDRWTASKLRYYLREAIGEVKEQGRPEQKDAGYPVDVLHKVLFISKLMEQDVRPSISQVKDILKSVSAEVLARVAKGAEQLEIGQAIITSGGETRYVTTKGDVYRPEDLSEEEVIQTSLAEHPRLQATDGVRVARRIEQEMREAGPRPASRPPWQTLRVGPDLEIRYRRTLSKDQLQQLKLAGDLIRSILGEE